jgi:hypothetical protein
MSPAVLLGAYPSATVVMEGAARQTHSTSYMKVSHHFEADILL